MRDDPTAAKEKDGLRPRPKLPLQNMYPSVVSQ